MKLVVLAVLLAGSACRDDKPVKPAATTEQDKVLREARETLAEGQAFVEGYKHGEAMMKEMKEDGLIAVAVLFANCDVRDADEAVVANRARLKPFLQRLRELDRRATRCTAEQRELADEILAAVKR